VEWLTLADGTRVTQRATSLAHLRRRATEKKWPEARPWCERRNLNRGYVLRKKGNPGPTTARAEERTASRYYQFKSGHALTGVYLKSTDNRPDDHCWWCDPDNISGTPQTRITSSSTARGGKTNRPNSGQGSRRRRKGGSGSGVWGTFWRMRGAALQCSISCGPPTWDGQHRQWRKIETATRPRKRRNRRWRRREF